MCVCVCVCVCLGGGGEEGVIKWLKHLTVNQRVCVYGRGGGGEGEGGVIKWLKHLTIDQKIKDSIKSHQLPLIVLNSKAGPI